MAHNSTEKSDNSDNANAFQEESFVFESSFDAMGGSIYSNTFSLMMPYKFKMYGSIAFGILSSLLSVAPFFLVYMVLIKFIQNSLSIHQLYTLGILGIGINFLRALCFNISTRISHLIAADIQKDIRLKLGNKLKKVPMGFFSTNDSRSIQKMITEDVEMMEDGIAHMIPEITATIIPPLVVIGSMFYMDWRLALASIVGIFGGFYMMGLSMKVSKEQANEYYAGKAKIARLSTELVAYLPLVKIFNQGGASLQKINESFEEHSQQIKDWIKSSISYMHWFILLSTSNLVFLTPVAVGLYYFDLVTIQTLVFFLPFGGYMNTLIMKFHGIAHRFTAQMNIHQRMNNFLKEKETVYTNEESVLHNYDIAFNDVHFSYTKNATLQGVTLHIPQGSSLALVGKSGAGKSTIAKLLPRFWDVNKGSITIGGIDIRNLSQENLSKNLSFVFQDSFLFSQSIKDNLLMAKHDASMKEIQEACEKAQIHDYITSLPKGYDSEITSNMNVSSGQRQRLCIARAILKDAPILVLDEATSFADPDNETQIQKAISNLIKGKTLIVVAHRLSTICNIDTIAVIDKGKVIELGPHKKLLAKKGDYFTMWNAHMQAKKFTLL